LIYNPSDLPPAPGDGAPPDLPVDVFVEIDANPAALALDPILQPPALEGQGVGGSAPALLFVRGTDIAPGATITVVTDPVVPEVTITVGTPAIATNGKSIAVPVTFDLSSLDEGPPVPLKVTVTQPPPNETITASVTWTLTTLDTFSGTGAQAPPPLGKVFSNATINNTLFHLSSRAREPMRSVPISSASRARITSAITCNGSSTALITWLRYMTRISGTPGIETTAIANSVSTTNAA
jgi:hypothetical protein